jgi:hypothetical protein
LTNYYELFGLGSTASADEIKKAFRQQIARYHPDKVHHLGKEFQEMATVRAAELTEAYRILSHESRRADYDRGRPQTAAAPASAPAPAGDRDAPAGASTPEEASSRPRAEPVSGAAPSKDRATVDQFVRKVTISRFRQTLDAVGQYDDSPLQGFDIACVPKTKMFGRGKGPRVLGRFVARVDADTIADAWAQAGKWGAAADTVCVFLMGSALATTSELAVAISAQRKKARTAKVTLIPVDARNWDAHVPTDAPAVAKDLLARLKSSA